MSNKYNFFCFSCMLGNLNKASTFGFQLALSVCISRPKDVVFSIHIRGLHCALLSLHLNTTFCSSSLLCCTLTGCVGLCCHCSHCVQSCGLGSELMVYKKCLVMGNRIGGKQLLGKWMFILKRVCWAGFSFPFLIMGWKIHFLLAPQSSFLQVLIFINDVYALFQNMNSSLKTTELFRTGCSAGFSMLHTCLLRDIHSLAHH